MIADVAAAARRKTSVLLVVAALIVVLPFLGKGGILGAAVLLLAVLGVPLFVIIGVATVLCLMLWAGQTEVRQFGTIIERIRTLADNPNLLAVPLFIMSGAIMSRGQISVRLVEFARSLVGWAPGGLAISAVVACMLFAAISGSSPATVVAIGAMMGPTLIANNYNDRFSHGLVTSAGSLGILIPPSIPMIIYPIVYQGVVMDVETLFASGFGPGLLIGGILIGVSVYRGIVDKTPRTPFRFSTLGASLRDGFWALVFPILILGGIYGGIFFAVEAAAISVVYAVVVEVWIHRALKLVDIPKIFQETGIFLGSLLVIMIAALALSEFLEGQGIAHAAVDWITGMDLEPWQFLIAINLLLLLVGCMMDILSAMFIFVPLLAPIAVAMGVDPIHFGIIFIVNLEIGYLTPPVGLNLFVASTLFDKPLGHMIKSVAPFIGFMLVGLLLVTYIPDISSGLGYAIMGKEPPVLTPAAEEEDETEGPTEGEEDEGERTLEEIVARIEEIRGFDGMPTGEMMQEEAELSAELDRRIEEARRRIEEIQSFDGMPTGEMMQEEAELQELLDRFAPDAGP